MQSHEFEVQPNIPDLHTEVSALEEVFARELTADLARDYVTSLVEKLGGLNQHPNEFIEKGRALHFAVGKEIYGPLIVGYCQWLADKCQTLGYEGNVYFALRDAAPIHEAATILWEDKKLVPVSIYANRPILGVDDEIAPELSSANGNVKTYFEKKGLQAADKIIWSDTGAWGTVIQVLKTKYLADKELYPFFWYSHNPYIPGYLNGLLEPSGLGDKFGEVLNDSMECMFPQKHLRPLQINEDSSDVILTPSNNLAMIWGQSALEGVKAGAKEYQKGISQDEQIHALIMLSKLSEQAKETACWTGVLPTNTPTWSKGAEFLAQFPANLVGKGDQP